MVRINDLGAGAVAPPKIQPIPPVMPRLGGHEVSDTSSGITINGSGGPVTTTIPKPPPIFTGGDLQPVYHQTMTTEELAKNDALSKQAVNISIARGMSPGSKWQWGILGHQDQTIDFWQNDAGWKQYADGSYESPEGIKYSLDEINAEIAAENARIEKLNKIRSMSTTDQIAAINEQFPELAQYFPEANVIPTNPTEDIHLWKSAGAQSNAIEPGAVEGFLDKYLSDRKAYVEDLSSLAGKFIPDEAKVKDFVNHILADPTKALSTLRQAGDNANTRALLTAAFPDLTDSEVRGIFGEAPVMGFDQWKLATYGQGEGGLFNALPFDEWKGLRLNAEPNMTEAELKEAYGYYLNLWPRDETIQREYQNYVAYMNDSSILATIGRSIDTGMGMWYAKAAAGTKYLGMDGLAASLASMSVTFENNTPGDPGSNPSLWENLTNPRFYATTVLQQTTSYVPDIALALVSGMVGMEVVAGAEALSGLSPFVIKALGGLVGGALPSFTNSAVAAGSGYDAYLTEHPGDAIGAKKAADQIFRQSFVMNEATNAIIMSTAFGPVQAPEAALQNGITKGLFAVKIVAGRSVVDGLTNAGQAYLQELIQRNALGQTVKWDDQMKMAVIIGAMQGLIFSLVGSAKELSKAFSERVVRSLPPDLQDTYRLAYEEAIASGLPEDHARIKALDIIAATPEGAKVIDAVARTTKVEGYEDAVKPATDPEKTAWEHTFASQKEAIKSETGVDVADAEQADYEAQVKAEVAADVIANDPVMQYRGKVGESIRAIKNKEGIQSQTRADVTRDISYFLHRPGNPGWPEYITPKEAEFFKASRATDNPGFVIESGPHKGMIDFGKTLQQFAEKFNMGEEQLKAHVESLDQIRGAGPGTPKGNLFFEVKPVDRVIKQSEEVVRQDRPNKLKQLINRFPGIKQFREWERPGLKLTGANEKILVAQVSESAAKSDVLARFRPDTALIIKKLKLEFGAAAVNKGAKLDIAFLGTGDEVSPINGTLLDIIQRSDLYDLTPAQKSLIADMDATNSAHLNYVVDGYDADIHEFRAQDGTYLPNVDEPKKGTQKPPKTERQAVASGRTKTRVYNSAAERVMADQTFNPVLDIQKLIEGLDAAKASAASGMTFRVATGGKTRLEVMQEIHPALYNKMMGLRKELATLQGSAGRLDSRLHQVVADFEASPMNEIDLSTLQDSLEPFLKSGPRVGLNQADVQEMISGVREQIRGLRPAWDGANMKDYVFVQDGIFRYFPSEQAALLKEIRASSNGAFDGLIGFMETWRGTAFSGDLSPIVGVQTPLGALFDPVGSLMNLGGSMKRAVMEHNLARSFSIDALAEDIGMKPTEWSEFFSLTGHPPAGTPTEFAGGLLSKIPGFEKFNEGTYIAVTRQQFLLWERLTDSLIKSGVPELEAKVTAASKVTEVFPLIQPERLGQSKAKTALIRSALTSYSFIRQPASMMGDAVTGFAKIVSFQHLTPKESLSVRLMTQMAASTLAVSALSAALDAQRRGDDVGKAVLDAINPNSTKFMSVIVNDKLRIPVGGPYRSLFKALWPQKPDGVSIPIPLWGMGQFFENRANPALKTLLDQIKNKDYYNKPIRSGNDIEQLLRGIEYEFENFVPLTLGAVIEDVRTGKTGQIPQDIITQFAGMNTVEMNKQANTTKDLINGLGQTLPPDPNKSSFSLDTGSIYSMTDLSSDLKSKLTYVDPLTVTEKNGYNPIVVNWLQEQGLKGTTDLLPSTDLRSINTDPANGDTIIQWFQQWQERGKITDPEALKAYDKANPNAYKGNISRAQYNLLLEYADSSDKTQFLKDHPELRENPRESYLIAHPQENAQLALWGQADVLTQAAYNQLQTLISTLDIPASAISSKIPTKDVAANYFKWNDLVSKYGTTTDPEAKLTRLNDPKLEGWGEKNLNWAPIKDDKTSLQIQVDYRADFDAYAALDTTKAKNDYLDKHLAFRDKMYISTGLDYTDKNGAHMPYTLALKYCAYRKASSPTGYRHSNPDLNNWMVQAGNWQPLS